mmetsp:Transcript_53213/g.121626  ORF Transcript_53213/g.121626 Transcript_53213/m.121626 type:complete len:203 (+) Transcript_53213:134-742(+)
MSDCPEAGRSHHRGASLRADFRGVREASDCRRSLLRIRTRNLRHARLLRQQAQVITQTLQFSLQDRFLTDGRPNQRLQCSLHFTSRACDGFSWQNLVLPPIAQASRDSFILGGLSVHRHLACRGLRRIGSDPFGLRLDHGSSKALLRGRELTTQSVARAALALLWRSHSGSWSDLFSVTSQPIQLPVLQPSHKIPPSLGPNV